MNIKEWLDKGSDLITEFGPKLLAAILIWIVGSWLIKIILKGIKKAMNASKYDDSLKQFFLNIAKWGLKIILVITILGTVGVQTTSLAAILAAAGLAIGMALQGSLGNLAGGVLIMIFRPFKIGDLIEAQGEHGFVKEIEIFTTKLVGLTNKEIIIPNGILSNGNIINYTTEGSLRVDLTFGISYDSDIKEAKNVLMGVLTSHPKVLKDPLPTVNVSELADSSVNFAVRPWCNPNDYWDVYFDITEHVKLALDKAGIEIPFPHSVQIRKKA